MHLSRGVAIGPPEYIKECYPRDTFVISQSVASHQRSPPEYGRFVGLRSLSFGDTTLDPAVEPPIFNAFECACRRQNQDLCDLLYNRSGHSTGSSISSIQSLDPRGRPSFSGGTTLRDLTANLRVPTRASGLWSGSFARTERNVTRSSWSSD
jgi:hypothetical protein